MAILESELNSAELKFIIENKNLEVDELKTIEFGETNSEILEENNNVYSCEISMQQVWIQR